MADCRTAREREWFRHLIGQYNFSMHPHPSLLASAEPRVRGLIGRLRQFGARPTVAGFSQVMTVEADGAKAMQYTVPEGAEYKPAKVGKVDDPAPRED